ncbi:hypothetical protein SAMN04487894_102341 [Niabella drilacis]|uniref:Uncharacterized protein n=1 Tax=Niabella drilacis (strain DSM 25811 / CCM 8410 / CCUG 62505 / LMG 26954 / E90) TaxID=1285928 RepID=A0A1G6LGH5_NIADE|nr:hypothetical protein SAMN04487894_102341 [Niabella drilacis]
MQPIDLSLRLLLKLVFIKNEQIFGNLNHMALNLFLTYKLS